MGCRRTAQQEDLVRRPGLLRGTVVPGRYSVSILILTIGFRAKLLIREELTFKQR